MSKSKGNSDKELAKQIQSAVDKFVMVFNEMREIENEKVVQSKKQAKIEKLKRMRDWFFTGIAVIWAVATFFLGYSISKNTSYLDYEYELLDFEACDYEKGCDIDVIPQKVGETGIKASVNVKVLSGAIDRIYFVQDTYTLNSEKKVEHTFLSQKITDTGIEHTLIENGVLQELKFSKTVSLTLMEVDGKEVIQDNIWVVIVDKNGNYKLDSVTMFATKSVNILFDEGNAGYKEGASTEIVKSQNFKYAYRIIYDQQATNKIELSNETEENDWKGNWEESNLDFELDTKFNEDDYIDERQRVIEYINTYIIK